MNSKPVLTVATVTALVQAVLYLCLEFGLHLTNGQQVGIMGLVGVVAPYAVWYVTRHVTDSRKAVEGEGEELS